MKGCRDLKSAKTLKGVGCGGFRNDDYDRNE